jgi:hypothetical protein
MKSDFSPMSRQKLRAYILKHRDDGEAIEALIKTRNPNSSTFAFPQTDEDLKKMEEILKQGLSANGKTA